MPDNFEGWAIVEIMGHRRLAGHVQEQEIAGSGFLRLDIPSDPLATQFYSPASIYCVTPTTEEIARRLASRLSVAPVHRWELPAPESDTEVEDPEFDDDEVPI